MTDEILDLANSNKEKSEAKHLVFIKGYIENIPLTDESVDVVKSKAIPDEVRKNVSV